MLKQSTRWDRLGIGLSGFCAIHCLFFPVMVAVLPLWPVAETLHHWTHPILLILIAPTLFFALKGGRNNPAVAWLLYTGFAVVGLAWVTHGMTGPWGEAVITLIGSTLLIAGHWINYRHHQTHRSCAHETT